MVPFVAPEARIEASKDYHRIIRCAPVLLVSLKLVSLSNIKLCIIAVAARGNRMLCCTPYNSLRPRGWETQSRDGQVRPLK